MVTPVLVLLVVFVLWAGRGGRAGLVTDLAAGEAATVASLYSDNAADAAERERVVEQILSARPGLELLCIGGPQPRALGSSGGFVDEAWLESFEPEIPGAARGVGALGVRLECETDGAVAPLLGWFPTVDFLGQASEVITLPPRPLLSVVAAEADEGDVGDNEQLMFLIEFDSPVNQDVDIFYRTDPGGGSFPATAGTDYTALPQDSLPIVSGNQSAIVTVNITGDDLYEYDETLNFWWEMVPSDPCASDAPKISSDANRLSADPSLHPVGHILECTPEDPLYWQVNSTGTIRNDDDPPRITVDNPTAAENAGTIDFTVRLEAATAVDVEFTAETLADTSLGANHATGGPPGCTALNCDYVTINPPTPHTITADPINPPSQTVNVTIVDDTIGEGDETFKLEATVEPELIGGNQVFHAGPSPVEGIGTIEDDEPKITIANETISEGSTPIQFTVTLNRVPPGVVTVDYEIVTGSGSQLATGGASCSDVLQPDYENVPGSGTLMFDPMDPVMSRRTEQDIEVVICDDSLDEHPNEWFGVKLRNPSMNASITDDYASGRIDDDDGAPLISVTGPAAPVVEGNILEFEITLNAASALPVQVDYSITDILTTAGDDYQINTPHSSSGKLMFAVGETTKTITVQSKRDRVSPEINETFEVALTSPVSNATLNPAQDSATGTIADYEVIELSIADAVALEGEFLEFAVTVNNPINEEFEVRYETADRTTGRAATATAGDDYVDVSSGTLIFGANETTRTIRIEALRDTVNEVHDETFFVSLTGVDSDHVALDRSVALGTIRNVILREVSIADAATVTEGQTLLFIARLDQPSTETITVEYDTRHDTATAGSDYVPISNGVLTFAPGETGKPVTVTTNKDQVFDELTEYLFVDLNRSTVQNAVVDDGTARGGIENSSRATLSVADVQVDEGEVLEFIVEADNLPASEEVTVVYKISDISTTAGDDYQIDPPHMSTGALTINGSVGSQTISITTFADATEPDESLRIDLSGPSANAVLGDPSAIGTILQECVDPNDSAQDPPALTVTPSIRTFESSGVVVQLPPGSFLESEDVLYTVETDAPFCVGETGVLTSRVRDITTNSNPIHNRVDFGFDFRRPDPMRPEHGYITGYDIDGRVSLVIDDDVFDEPNETFYFEVNWAPSPSMPPHYQGLSWIGNTVTIVDDDSPTNLRVSQGTAREGEDVVFVVTLEQRRDPVWGLVNPIASDLTVAYETEEISGSGSYATEGATSVTPDADYTRTTGTLTFVAGHLYGHTHDVRVPTRSDTNNETRETFRLNLSLDPPQVGCPDPAPSSACLDPNNATITRVGTIIDTVLPIMSISDIEVVEDVGTAMFTVTLDQASTSQVTVNYETVQLSTGDYAEAPSDYTSATAQVLTIPIGATSATIPVTIIDDTNEEPAENFQLRLSLPNNAVLGDGTAQATIIDNDGVCIDPSDLLQSPPGFTIEDRSTVEDDNTLSFTLTLDEPLCEDAIFKVTTEDDTATGGIGHVTDPGPIDYVGWITITAVIIPAYHTEYSIAVRVVEDDLVEADETFNLLVRWADSMPTIYRVQPTVTAVGTIVDDDGDLVVGVINDPEVAEGETLGFIVSLDKPGGRDVTVEYETSDLTATAGQDYEQVSGTAEILEGDTTVLIPVLTLSDDVSPESNETFQLVLSGPTGARLGDFSGVGTITDVAQPRISVTDETVDEGEVLEFEVRLDRPANTVVAVDFETNDLTTTAGQDYSPVSGTLQFPPGEQIKTVKVATSADGIDEGPEDFQLVLSNPVNAGLRDAIGTGTINNTDAPQVRVSDLTVVEGNTFAFELTLNEAAPSNVVVPYTTADSTAAADEDYITTADTVTFFASETSAQVPVITIDDRLDEDPESLQLQLLPPTGAVLADRIAIGTIFDNDDPPEVSLSQTEATADEPAGSITFTISLSEISGRDVVVAYTTDDRTATAGEDYTDNDGTVTISAGQISATVDVVILDDTDDEGAETFRFSLSSTGGYPTNARLGSITAAEGIIIDDDSTQPSVLLRNASSAVEGLPATVEVWLDRPAEEVISMNYSTSDGTASATDGDYTAVTDGLVQFGLDDQTMTITVPTTDDSDIETPETFTVSLENVSNAQLLHQSATLTILDNDGVPDVSIDDAPSVVEGGVASFTVRQSVAVNQPVTVTYEARVDPTAGDSSAIPGVDFALSAGTVTIASGQTTQTITVPTIEDVFDEANETFWLQLTSSVGAQIRDSTAEGQILDDDPLPSLSIGDATTVEGESAVFTVRIDAPSGRDVTATYAPSPNTSADDPATAGTDFSAAPGILRIPRGTTETTIEVLTNADAEAEHDEAFLVVIGNPGNAEIRDDTGQGIIFDSNGEPRLSVANVALFEDQGPAEFTVSLSHTSTDDVTVGYVTFDGTATEPGDYTFTSATLTIVAGTNRATISIPIVDDTLEEADETFRLQLTSPANATISDQEALAVIFDDDGTPRISVGDVEALENNADGTIDFPVTLSHVAAHPVTVRYTTFDGTATQPADYLATSGTLTIPAGATSATISVTIVDDNLTEGQTTVVPHPYCLSLPNPDNCHYTITVNQGGETILLRLDTPTGAILEATEATGTITDDEPLPGVSSTPWDAVANENDGEIVFWPTLSHPSIHTVTASYRLEAITNSGESLGLSTDPALDRSSGEVVFPPGSTTAPIRVPIYDNTYASYNPRHYIAYNNVTFRVTLVHPTENADVWFTAGSGLVWDDESPPYIAAFVGQDVLESAGEAVFTLALNRISDQDTTVSYRTSISGSTATVGTDYTPTMGTVTFPAGTNTAEVTVPILDDNIDEQSESIVLEVVDRPENVNFAVLTNRIDVERGTVLIIDDDETPVLSIGDAQAIEVSETLTFLVSLNRASSQEITVDYATNDGTATQPGDYTETMGSLTIAPGDTTTTITVPIIDDGVAESTENFTVTLSNASEAILGADPGDDQATGVILDGDSLPIITMEDQSRSENISVTSRHIGFCAEIAATSAVQITVEFRVVAVPSLGDESADLGIDFDDTPFLNTGGAGTGLLSDGWYRIRITVGQTTSCFTFDILSDLEPERDERFLIELRNPVNAVLGNAQAWGTIENDDLPIVTISDVDVSEDQGSAVLSLRLHDEGLDPASLLYRTKVLAAQGYAATPGDDYTHTEGQLDFAVGQTFATITVPLINDGADEYNEQFLLELHTPVNLNLSDTTAAIRIADDDPGWHITDTTAEEGQTMRFTATRDNATDPLTLNYTIGETDSSAAGGTHCTDDVDYITPTGTLAFTAGQTSAVISINTCDDTLPEGSEIFFIQLTGTTPDQSPGFAGRKLLATATLTDND